MKGQKVRWNMVMCTTFGLKSRLKRANSLFLHKFCLNWVQMILGYLHIYGAEEGEVKGHVGSKGQVEYGHVHHFNFLKLVNNS